MQTEIWTELEQDFESWSGGFPPESEHEIVVYVDYANPFGRRTDVFEYLLQWLARASSNQSTQSAFGSDGCRQN